MQERREILNGRRKGELRGSLICVEKPIFPQTTDTQKEGYEVYVCGKGQLPPWLRVAILSVAILSPSPSEAAR